MYCKKTQTIYLQCKLSEWHVMMSQTIFLSHLTKNVFEQTTWYNDDWELQKFIKQKFYLQSISNIIATRIYHRFIIDNVNINGHTLARRARNDRAMHAFEKRMKIRALLGRSPVLYMLWRILSLESICWGMLCR